MSDANHEQTKKKRADHDAAALIQTAYAEELHEKEQRCKNILNNVPVVVFELTADRTVEYINRTMELFGCEVDAIVGSTLTQCFHPTDRPTWEALFDECEKTQAGTATPVLQLLASEGSPRYVNARVQRMEDGKYVGSLDDVTVQRRIEADLLIAQRLDSIGDLAARTAHDFNNLLTVILGNINLAQRRIELDSGQLKELDLAARACDRATALTSKMLHFSKDWEPNCRPSDLGQLVEEALDLCLSGSPIECQLQVESDLPPVEMDPSQIHQVINNLVLNAMDAMPEGGRLHVEVLSSDNDLLDRGPTPGVSVIIRDTGQGMPLEIQKNIFEPFFTTKLDPEAGIGGEGLGLYSSFQIIKQHLGLLELVDSVPGEGTTFRITLPIAHDSVGDDDAEHVVESAARGRILIMDDDDRVRELLVAMLDLFGHEVVATHHGEQCIDAFVEHREAGRPFDLVITDLTVVGGRGGDWAIEKLRLIDPEVRVVVASGSATDPVMASPREHGFIGALHKPYSIDVVESMMNSLLGENAAG